MARKKKRHCQHCGAEFPQNQMLLNPLSCSSCKKPTFDNVPSISVILIPCPGGLYGVKRGPKVDRSGFAALPGGYMMPGELWQTAGARECYEEIQVRIPDPVESIDLFDTKSTPDGLFLIVFGIVKPNVRVQVDAFMQNDEASARLMLHTTFNQEFAYPLHYQAYRDYMNGKRRHLAA